MHDYIKRAFLLTWTEWCHWVLQWFPEQTNVIERTNLPLKRSTLLREGALNTSEAYPNEVEYCEKEAKKSVLMTILFSFTTIIIQQQYYTNAASKSTQMWLNSLSHVASHDLLVIGIAAKRKGHPSVLKKVSQATGKTGCVVKTIHELACSLICQRLNVCVIA